MVEELYERYQRDRTTVDRAWWDFFEHYTPGSSAGTSGDSGSANGSAARSTPGSPPDAPSPAPSSSAPSSASPHHAAVPTPADPASTSPRHAAPTPTDTTPTSPAGATAPASASSAVPAGATPSSSSAPGTSRQPDDAAVRGRSGESTPAAQQPAERPAPPMPREATSPAGGAPSGEDRTTALRGATARVVTNMETSLEVPTATSVRAVPAKLLVDNRIVINNHLTRSRGGKVSFTHLIGYALVKALEVMPEMNNGFARDDNGKPMLVTPAHVGLGIAIDLARPDGTRQLLVPSVRPAETMDFAHFWTAYEDVVKKARAGNLTAADFQGTTITLTNPGTIGTVHSVPRLMSGQGAIIGVGAMDYPAEWQGASTETLNRNAVSKILTLTSTYDHRVIQGAQSGEFLRIVHGLLLGEQGFYDEV
ncbi:MAG: 2-oxo acid dehydrogenase subunit E2, partial [Dermatophilaceae bacterium]